MEENLKQRLVGALVLFLLAIIFLPLVLDGRDEVVTEAIYQAPKEPVIHITHQGSDVVKKRLAVAKQVFASDRATPEESDEPVVAESKVTKASRQKSINARDQKSVDETKKMFVKELVNAKAEKVKKVDERVALAQAWTVQVAAFSLEGNAKKLQSLLIRKSYMAYIEPDKTGGKPLYRVFVGPELRKNRARIIQQALKKEFKLAGMIKTFRP